MRLWRALVTITLRRDAESKDAAAAMATLFEVIQELARAYAARYRLREMADDVANDICLKIWATPRPFLAPLRGVVGSRALDDRAALVALLARQGDAEEAALDAVDVKLRAYLGTTVENRLRDVKRKKEVRISARQEEFELLEGAEVGPGDVNVDVSRADELMERALAAALKHNPRLGELGPVWRAFRACAQGDREVDALVCDEIAAEDPEFARRLESTRAECERCVPAFTTRTKLDDATVLRLHAAIRGGISTSTRFRRLVTSLPEEETPERTSLVTSIDALAATIDARRAHSSWKTARARIDKRHERVRSAVLQGVELLERNGELTAEEAELARVRARNLHLNQRCAHRVRTRPTGASTGQKRRSER